MQCQVVLRSSLKSSIDQVIKDLWKCTSSKKNFQYDTCRHFKDVLKTFRTTQEERLQNDIISQGSFISFIMDQSLSSLDPIWSSVQSQMPKNIFNFTIRYMNNTFAAQKNLAKISLTSECSFCSLPETLLHIVAGCKSYLDQGRYTWSHDSVLMHIAKSFKALQGIKLFLIFLSILTHL